MSVSWRPTRPAQRVPSGPVRNPQHLRILSFLEPIYKSKVTYLDSWHSSSFRFPSTQLCKYLIFPGQSLCELEFSPQIVLSPVKIVLFFPIVQFSFLFLVFVVSCVLLRKSRMGVHSCLVLFLENFQFLNIKNDVSCQGGGTRLQFQYLEDRGRWISASLGLVRSCLQKKKMM